jgi:hypothetical protein
MGQSSLSFASRNARSVLSLAFLVWFTIVSVIALSLHGAPAQAFSSPRSPLDVPRTLVVDRSPLPAPARAAAMEAQEAPRQPVWRLILGIGLIAMGVALFVGGSIFLMRR